jgi:hypothetical protein
MRQQISLYLEESQENYTAALKHALEQMKNGCISEVRDLLNVNLDQQLERTQGKINELIRIIETEGEERTQKVNFAREQEEAAASLLDQGAELSVELEMQMNDHVEQEVL